MSQHLELKVEHFWSEPPEIWDGRTGMIDASELDGLLKGRDSGAWLHVLCGPFPMIEGIEAVLLGRGVPSDQIISERFCYD